MADGSGGLSLDGVRRSSSYEELPTDILVAVCRLLPGATVLALRLVSPAWRATINVYALRERRWALARLIREPVPSAPPLPEWTPANCGLPGDARSVDLVAAVTRLSDEPWPAPDAAWERQALDALEVLVAQRGEELLVAHPPAPPSTRLSYLPRALPAQLGELSRLSDWASPALGVPPLSFWASAATLMLTARGGAEARCIAHWLHHCLPATSVQLTVAADELCHALSMLFSSQVWSGCPALQGLAADWRSVSMPALDAATPPPPRGLTSEQVAVVSWARQLGKRIDGVPGLSAKVLAFAGSGKSHTLGAIAGALQPGVRVLYLAYNSALAKEAKSWPAFIEVETRTGVKVDAFTTHALAHTHVMKPANVAAAMKQKLGQGSGVIKVFNLLKGQGWTTTQAEVTAAMQACQNFHRSGDDELGAQHIQSELPAVPALAKALIERMENPGDTFPITHDAYLSMYCRARQPLPWGGHDVILVDEVQDLGAAALRVLERARLERGCAVVYTGDMHQHLYAFAGARNGLAELATDATFRLTRTFRFGAALAAAADKLLVLKGETVPLRGARGMQTRFARAASEAESVPPDIGRRNHAVLVRMNATWFKLAVQAIDAGHRVYVEDMETTLRKLEELARLTAKALQERSAAAKAENDIAACSLHRLLSVMTPALVLNNIDKLRAMCVGRLDATALFFTVHKAKGQQFESCELTKDVWDCLEEEAAANAFNAFTPEKRRDDELHICYTALTRATTRVELPSELMERLDDYPRLMNDGHCGSCEQGFNIGYYVPGIWCGSGHLRMFCATCALQEPLDDGRHALPLAALAARLQALELVPAAAGDMAAAA